MPVSSDVMKAGPYFGDDFTTEFPFNFRVFGDDDVLVAITNPDGAEITLTNDQYTVALNYDQASNPGGTITTNTPLKTGYLLMLASQIPEDQELDLTNQDGFYPQVITRAMDKLTLLVKQLSLSVSRAAKVPLSGDSFDDLIQQLSGSIVSAESSAIDAFNSAFEAQQSQFAAAQSAGEAEGYRNEAEQFLEDLKDASDPDDPDKGSNLVGHRGKTLREIIDRFEDFFVTARDVNFDGGTSVILPEQECAMYGALVSGQGGEAFLGLNTLNPAMVSDFFVWNIGSHTVWVGINGAQGVGTGVPFLPGQIGWVAIAPGGLVSVDGTPEGLGYSTTVNAVADSDIEPYAHQCGCQDIYITDTGSLLTQRRSLVLTGRISRPRIHNQTDYPFDITHSDHSGSISLPPGRSIVIQADDGVLVPLNLSAPLSVNSISANTTAGVAHINAHSRVTASLSFTIDGGLDAPFRVGDEIRLRVSDASATLTLVQGSDCTLNIPTGAALTCSTEGGIVTLCCVSYDAGTGAVEFDVWGDLD